MKLEELFNSLKLQPDGNSSPASYGDPWNQQNRLPMQPQPPLQPVQQQTFQNLNPNTSLPNNEVFPLNRNYPNPVEPPPGLFSPNVPLANVNFVNNPAMAERPFLFPQQAFPSQAISRPQHLPTFGSAEQQQQQQQQLPFESYLANQVNIPAPNHAVPFQAGHPFPQFSTLQAQQQHQVLLQQQQRHNLEQQQQQLFQQQLAYQQRLNYYYNFVNKPNQNDHSLFSTFNNHQGNEQVLANNGEISGHPLQGSLFNNSKMPNQMPQNDKNEINVNQTQTLPVKNEPKKSIRVNVNDLFSLSKAYSETNNNTDANKILFDLLQNQTEGKSVVPANVSQSNDSISNKNLSNEAPKELTNLNENYCADILKQLRKDLQTTSDSIFDIMKTYQNVEKRNYIFTMIKQYFYYLSQRFQSQSVTYLNLIDVFQYSYDDFASYGPRFLEFIQNSNFFTPKNIKEFTSLLKKYEQIYPVEIVEIRKKLLEMKLVLCKSLEILPQKKIEQEKLVKENSNLSAIEKQNQLKLVEYCPPIPVNYNMVTFQKIDSKNLHYSVSSIRGIRDQINFFIKKTSLSAEGLQSRDEFLECLNKALQNSELAVFRPTLHKFGSLTNGMPTYDSDIDIVIKFENLKFDVLDYSTSMLALEVIECILQEQIGIQAKETIVPSKRCPIIKLNFNACFPQLVQQIRAEQKSSELEFSKCDISLLTSYGVYNSKLLHFLTQYDYRFRELTLILKYWAKRNELIDTTTFSSYGFTMLIIFFLQNTNPPVLPTIAQLQELAKRQPGNEAIMVNKFNFQFCNDVSMVGRSKNIQSVPDLLLDFFRFYVKFDFYNYAVSPRLGTAILKINMRKEKLNSNYDNFNMASYICIEDPFVLEHNVGFIFRARNILRFGTLLRSMIYKLTPSNCLKVLVDPKNVSLNRYCSSCVFMPFNLFCYEMIINEHFLAYPFQSDSISLKPVTHQVPLKQSTESMQKFFFIIIRHLLVSYFAFENCEDALQLELNPDGSVVCSVDFAYLSHINFKLDFRKNHKYDILFQNCRKRSSDALRRFSLLKTLRKDLHRVNVHSTDLRDRPVVPSCKVERWFKLELPNHPAVHQLQLAPASYQALLDANEKTVLPYYHFRMCVQSSTKNFAIASRYGELIQEILQKFCFSIDRVNAIASFASQVEDFFEP